MTGGRLLTRLCGDATSDFAVLCLPYAGGGSHVFTPWREHVPPSASVISVDPPGRRTRIGTSPFQRVDDYVNALVHELQNTVRSPWVLFGHSLGALVGYHLLRRLLDCGAPLPQHFVASGCRAPHRPYRFSGAHRLPDREFRDFLLQLGGTPPELLEDDDVYAWFDASLRADFMLAGTQCEPPSEPIERVAATVLYAVDDPVVSLDDVAEWRNHFRHIEWRSFRGGHFFIECEASRAQVCEIVTAAVEEVS